MNLFWRKKLCHKCRNIYCVSNYSPCYTCKKGSNYQNIATCIINDSKNSHGEAAIGSSDLSNKVKGSLDNIEFDHSEETNGSIIRLMAAIESIELKDGQSILFDVSKDRASMRIFATDGFDSKTAQFDYADNKWDINSYDNPIGMFMDIIQMNSDDEAFDEIVDKAFKDISYDELMSINAKSNTTPVDAQ